MRIVTMRPWSVLGNEEREHACRFCPTSGRLTRVSIPKADKCEKSPMPESKTGEKFSRPRYRRVERGRSVRRCGVLTAPAERMISLVAFNVYLVPKTSASNQRPSHERRPKAKAHTIGRLREFYTLKYRHASLCTCLHDLRSLGVHKDVEVRAR